MLLGPVRDPHKLKSRTHSLLTWHTQHGMQCRSIPGTRGYGRLLLWQHLKAAAPQHVAAALRTQTMTDSAVFTWHRLRSTTLAGTRSHTRSMAVPLSPSKAKHRQTHTPYTLFQLCTCCLPKSTHSAAWATCLCAVAATEPHLLCHLSSSPVNLLRFQQP